MIVTWSLYDLLGLLFDQVLPEVLEGLSLPLKRDNKWIVNLDNILTLRPGLPLPPVSPVKPLTP